MSLEQQYSIMLARMYGVAETLEPLNKISMKDFIDLIDAWSMEFSNDQESNVTMDDLIDFFNAKIKMLKE